MRTLYIRNVPDAVASRLEELAARAGLSLNALAVRELTAVARRSGNAALLATLPDTGATAADVVEDLDSGRANEGVIVLDASAAVLGLLRGGTTRTVMGSDVVAAPNLIDVGIANALRNRVHRGLLGGATALDALRVREKLAIGYHSGVGLLDRVRELRENLSVDDALYVAVAESLECTLLTADDRLACAPGPRCPIDVATS